MARFEGVTKQAIETFYDNIDAVYQVHDAHEKPTLVYNADETGFQLINEVGKVLAAKGQKRVQAISTGERGKLEINKL